MNPLLKSPLLLKTLAILIASLGLFLGGFFYGKGKAPPAPPAIVQTVEVVKEVVVEKKAQTIEKTVWRDKEGNTIEVEKIVTVEEKSASKDNKTETAYEKLLPKYQFGALINPASPTHYSAMVGYRLWNTPVKAVVVVQMEQKKLEGALVGLSYEL